MVDLPPPVLDEMPPPPEQTPARVSVGRSIFDWLLGFVGGLALAILGSIVLTVVLALAGVFEIDDLRDESPLWFILIGGVIQQLSQGMAALFVQAKGFGSFTDWRIKFDKTDPLIGLAAVPVLIGCAFLVQIIALFFLGIDEPPTNTGIITDSKGSGWIVLTIFLAVVMAPIIEEIVFRGMTLRIFDGIVTHLTGSKVAGHILAVALSSLIFGLLHFPDEGGMRNYVLIICVIGTVGALLAGLTLYYDRLGPAVWAHGYFNLFGVVTALAIS